LKERGGGWGERGENGVKGGGKKKRVTLRSLANGADRVRKRGTKDQTLFRDLTATWTRKKKEKKRSLFASGSRKKEREGVADPSVRRKKTLCARWEGERRGRDSSVSFTGKGGEKEKEETRSLYILGKEVRKRKGEPARTPSREGRGEGRAPFLFISSRIKKKGEKGSQKFLHLYAHPHLWGKGEGSLFSIFSRSRSRKLWGGGSDGVRERKKGERRGQRRLFFCPVFRADKRGKKERKRVENEDVSTTFFTLFLEERTLPISLTATVERREEGGGKKNQFPRHHGPFTGDHACSRRGGKRKRGDPSWLARGGREGENKKPRILFRYSVPVPSGEGGRKGRKKKPYLHRR